MCLRGICLCVVLQLNGTANTRDVTVKTAKKNKNKITVLAL